MAEILFLAHRVPFPPDRGDRIRSCHILKKLATLGQVHVGCFADDANDRAGIDQLEKISASRCVVNRSKPLPLAGAQALISGKPVSLTAFHSAKLEDWVRETLIRYPIEAIVVFSGQMGQYIPADFKGRTVVDLCDVDSAKFESYADNGERVWLNKREGRLLAAEEARLAKLCDTTVLISQAEAALFWSRLGTPARLPDIRAIGNGIDAEHFNPESVAGHRALDPECGPHFVFTGQMDYRPNEAAALWAIERFLPAMRARAPHAQFHVVGRKPTAALKAHDHKNGVRIWGQVPDVRPFLAAADCALAPLQIARGVQNKVLEAMAMARPVLLTEEAATGINASDGQDWMIAPCQPEMMAERFCALQNTPNAKQAMGANARRFVIEHHAWDAMLEPFDQLIRGARHERQARNAA